jgi:hypothetical protein
VFQLFVFLRDYIGSDDCGHDADKTHNHECEKVEGSHVQSIPLEVGGQFPALLAARILSSIR